MPDASVTAGLAESAPLNRYSPAYCVLSRLATCCIAAFAAMATSEARVALVLFSVSAVARNSEAMSPSCVSACCDALARPDAWFSAPV